MRTTWWLPTSPGDDDAAGLDEYADTVVEAIGDRRRLLVVGQSFGGFTAPLAVRNQADRDGVTGHKGSYVLFYHDVLRNLAERAMRRGRRQSSTPGAAPWPLKTWPNVPTKFVLCTEDSLFPAEYLRRVVAARLHIVPDEIAAGHCVALSRPTELAALLNAYATGSQPNVARGMTTARVSS